MIDRKGKVGFTLLELVAALMIAAGLAALSMHYLQVPGQTSKQRSCDLTREVLQDYADRYQQSQGRGPSADLRELQTSQYAGVNLPTCPVTGQAYTLVRSGVVSCPTHEATR
jgi:competence protein ComGC